MGMPLFDDIDEALDVGAPFTDDEIVEMLFPTIGAGDAQVVAVRPDLSERRERFRIETVGHLDWAGRKMRRQKGRCDEIDQHVASQIAALRKWQTDAKAGPVATIEWLSGLLVDHANQQRQASNGSTKTVTAPSVKVSGKKLAPTVQIADRAAFVAWAREACPDAVEDQDPKIVKGNLPAVRIVEVDGELVVFSDGERVPGAVGQDPEISAKVRTVEIASPRTDGGEGFTVATEFVSYTVTPTKVATPGGDATEVLESLGLVGGDDES